MKAIDLINDTMEKAREFDDDDEELNEFLVMMGLAVIACMRGIHGDQFVTDYLMAELNDQEKLTYVKGGFGDVAWKILR